MITGALSWPLLVGETGLAVLVSLALMYLFASPPVPWGRLLLWCLFCVIPWMLISQFIVHLGGLPEWFALVTFLSGLLLVLVLLKVVSQRSIHRGS